jgi:hypothetical protein
MPERGGRFFGNLGFATCGVRSRLLRKSPLGNDVPRVQKWLLMKRLGHTDDSIRASALRKTFSEDSMDINSIGSNFGIDALTTTQTAATQALATGNVATADSAQLSPMASLLNQLQQLQQTDPDKFKSVMSSIADTLKTDAQNATGPKAQRLNALADKFSQAAQTGQMPELQPKGQQQGASGHHHHHQVQNYQEGSGAANSGQNQPTFDLAQIIQSALQPSSG